MKLYNTLSHSIEEFKPAKEAVTMYTCGPTVYDHMHIGNLRTFVFSDLLYRTLKFNGYEIKSVQNITDIEDKIIKKAKEEGKTIDQVTSRYYDLFIKDVSELNIPLKSDKNQPKATEYIDKMIKYIEVLVEKGYAYVEEDGSVYFDISKFPSYGKLSGVEKRELKTGTRALSDEYTKEDVQDFALWKSVSEQDYGFSSPWGKGRPGWHIECSVMSQDTLGNKIDIHTGGTDLIFPHHENEIAQSEAKTGESPFVKFWVHAAHLLVDKGKMSKSLKNFYTLSDIKDRGYEPLALRYLFLQTHYRQEMNFTWESLAASQAALKRLRHKFLTLKSGAVDSVFVNLFKQIVSDDLNIPKALGQLWSLLKTNPTKESVLEVDKIFGLSLNNEKNSNI
jgi:cysteinyl-tRNA synthetase